MPRDPLPAPLAVPVAATALLTVGAVAAATSGALGQGGVLACSCAIVAVTAVAAEPFAVLAVTAVAVLTVLGFSRAPYAELRLTGLPVRADVLVLAGIALALTAGAAAARRLRRRSMLGGMGVGTDTAKVRRRGIGRYVAEVGGIGRRRTVLGLAITAGGLPLLTLLLTQGRGVLSLLDDLLIYLVLVLAVTVVGGFRTATVAAVSASLLLNWYFTPPLHTLTIEQPQNLLGLLLFVASALLVSAIVHLAAGQARAATAAGAEAAALLSLARTVLGGGDTPDAVLGHLTASLGLAAELQERSGDTWLAVARSGVIPSSPDFLIVGPDLRLAISPPGSTSGRRLLDGYAAQAAAALDRDRLRTQAALTEVLREGNRIRTALLAAVSHDLRTPLAAVKAGVSTLRSADLHLTAADQAELLATVDEGADRLAGLITNLLDASRLHAGSLQPFLRPTAVDEVAPLALRGLDNAHGLRLDLPDDLPLVSTDPGLLERALANLCSNALRFSPPHVSPRLTGRAKRDSVEIQVVDHGPGVAAADRERMFEPFQRLGDRGGAGVGLGLAVARGFIEAMGGQITADGTPGGGLTMTVTLPRAAPDPAHPAHRTSMPR